MADISKIRISGTTYDLKDETARDDIEGKQDRLTSGTTIKTINNTSVLGSGNIPAVQGDYDSTNTKVELEQGTSALSFIQTTDGLSVTANTGSGSDFIDRELVSKTYVSQYQTQAQVEALILDELSRFDKLDYQIVTTLPATGSPGVRYLVKHATDDRYEEYIYIQGQWYDIGATDEVNLNDYYTKTEADLLLADKADTTDIPTLTSELTNDGDGTNNFVTFGDAATDSTYGVVKTNASKSISLNANGQLEVGGRLGQFTDGGVFYPDTIEPTNVGGSTFMMTDGAKYLSLGPRTFGIMAGTGITCKSAAAGSTQYRLSNTQGNRFTCFANKGGRIALDQIDATENGTALMTDISFANGNPISAYFGPTESGNDIIITVDRTVNPSAATTKLRMYGTSLSSDVIIVGQGNGASGGKAISLGQACHAGGNQCIAFGNSSLSLANNSVALGHTHLVNKQFCFAAGQGHDFTNGSNGAGAVGICSEISSDTAFAVGNGVFNSNGNITRSNALEVKADGSIVLKSPNGTKYKIAVDNSGNLTTTAI